MEGVYQLLDLHKEATAPTELDPHSGGMTTLNALAVDSQVQSLLAQFPIAPVQTQTVTVNVCPYRSEPSLLSPRILLTRWITTSTGTGISRAKACTSGI